MRFVFAGLFFLGAFASAHAEPSRAFQATPRALAQWSQDRFEARRLEIRRWVISKSLPPDTLAVPTIAPAENDRAANLVDRLEYDNLARMEEAGLLEANLPASPWSDFYWPTYAGQLANRYADPEFRSLLLWSDNAAYLTKVLGRGSKDHFSPAEKYDTLVGDSNFTLTRLMIRAGERYANEHGEVESWFGLCHGWAPASFMLPRPTHSVIALATNGREVEFTPTDLKALATLLWANGSGYTRFVGGRCNDKKPERGDGDREINPDCFDTNPATWHIAAVNQLGVAKRSFVMDASAGMEVWNQPLYGYSYAYIHPVTGASSKRLTDAKIRIKDFTNDPYRATRSAEAEYIVKIVMTVDYIAENIPSTEKTDGPDRDNHTIINYSYDLELASDDRIVGGEWHTAMHPDFLWVPAPNAQARSTGDAVLDRSGDRTEWKPGQPMPAAWHDAARISAQRQQPLARIVQELIQRAQ